ncbi:MAG: homoserine kinase, partial [Steroidobacteraceae bacterium]
CRGLGSSAAAIVTGVLAARAVTAEGLDLLPDSEVLRLAARLEGHADNVAACLLGGLVVTWWEDEIVRATSCPLLPDIAAVLYVPAEYSSTAHARALLPATVPHVDAAANAGRTALLVHALGQDPSLLLPATRDWLHQDVRAVTMPASAEVIARLRRTGVAAVLSGAGPSVLALLRSEVGLPRIESNFVAQRIAVASQGATAAAAQHV